MAGRLRAGKANADIAWYNGNGVNTISSSSDYRVPLWDTLVSPLGTQTGSQLLSGSGHVLDPIPDATYCDTVLTPGP
jgi:hypothetical protein